jgi:hypothetical protein
MRRRRVQALLILLLLLAGAGIYSVSRALREPTELAMLHDSLAVLRAAADSCREAVDSAQVDLLAYNTWLDSLRGRVRQLESHDPRGVPADSYDVYMGVFDRYNDSVGTWQGRVESLQAGQERCLAVTAAHNELADTLRRRRGGQAPDSR